MVSVHLHTGCLALPPWCYHLHIYQVHHRNHQNSCKTCFWILVFHSRYPHPIYSMHPMCTILMVVKQSLEQVLVYSLHTDLGFHNQTRVQSTLQSMGSLAWPGLFGLFGNFQEVSFPHICNPCYGTAVFHNHCHHSIDSMHSIMYMGS